VQLLPTHSTQNSHVPETEVPVNKNPISMPIEDFDEEQHWIPKC